MTGAALRLQRRLPLAVLKQWLANDWCGSKVATALTACGIETFTQLWFIFVISILLQRRLPLAVLKLHILNQIPFNIIVATALTACGIETHI